MHRRIGVVSALAALLMSTSARSQEVTPILAAISAGTIAAVSDGDFVAETYANGRLAPAEANYKDVLTVMSLADGKLAMSQIEVSNSVTAAPEIMQLTRDGRTAFVVERLAARSDRAQTMRDLAPGKRLFAIDLTSKDAPRHAGAAEIEPFPEAMAVSPDGNRVAVVSNTPDASLLQIVRYADGKFEVEARIDLRNVGVSADAAAGPRGGITATNVQWHPSGNYLAINISSQNRIAFVEVSYGHVRAWGNVVDVGRDPYVGRFTPDGRYYITSDWGRNLTETAVEARIPATPSQVSVIRFSADAGVGHTRVATAPSDLSAEGLAVSPDGRLIATVNMRTTAFPPASPRFRREASVSLFSFHPDSGAIEKLGDTPFAGVLPEGGVFDLTGDHFLATVFQGHAGEKNAAGLEVFRVVKQDRPQLIRLGRVALPHGVHQVDVAR